MGTWPRKFILQSIPITVTWSLYKTKYEREAGLEGLRQLACPSTGMQPGSVRIGKIHSTILPPTHVKPFHLLQKELDHFPQAEKLVITVPGLFPVSHEDIVRKLLP